MNYPCSDLGMAPGSSRRIERPIALADPASNTKRFRAEPIAR